MKLTDKHKRFCSLIERQCWFGNIEAACVYHIFYAYARSLYVNDRVTVAPLVAEMQIYFADLMGTRISAAAAERRASAAAGAS